MKIMNNNTSVINKIKKRAHVLGEKLLIVFKPEKAGIFLADIRVRVFKVKNTYKILIKKVRQFGHFTHEVENIFDNYYIVDGAISDILNNISNKGLKKLVQVEKQPNVYIPRIYYILSAFVKVSEYKVERESLYSFLNAYQSKAHLSIRELSFVPFFLRLILIENMEERMHQSIVSINDSKDAEYWFTQIVKKKEKNKVLDYSKFTSNLTQKYGVIPVNLGFNLLQRLSQYGPDTRPVVKWLKLNLLKQGINISNLAEIENKRQTDISIQISNIINSLRWINQARWDDFVVELNIVDSFLIKDPANIYMTLDSASQAVYRNEVVKISDRSGVYESEVVKLALRLCSQALNYSKDVNAPESHVGYYLVGAGQNELKRRVGYQIPIKEKLQSFILKNSQELYLGSILFFDAILTVMFVLVLPLFSGGFIMGITLLLLIIILNCDVAINLINILISNFIPVRALFRSDLSSGVLQTQATFVVVPSMFRDKKTAKELLRRLEVNYLGNANKNIYYALLMDFRDSKIEVEPLDQGLVDQVSEGIRDLNKKYPSNINKFYLFHRQRVWNPHENIFMGWERKRGKLREFNLLLRNLRKTSYVQSIPLDLPHIKYILTIDEDTRLPKDSAIKLIGCIDHPLNRPIVDYTLGKVISGYGIIQPRMTTRFSLARATAFSRLFSSAIGIDSYNGPGADVYQDLFNNSIFFGKGIYDIDAMEATIGDRIPENQVLSHDLLEGLYTRVGFATDISLFEGFPESYKEYILRMHRWIRGDWQIISWLKFNPAKNNNFSISDKWKIFDNLRRSTIPIFSIVFLALSYVSSPSFYNFSALYILFILGSSFIISYLIRLTEWPKDMNLFMKFGSIVGGFFSLIRQIGFRLVFLLDQAFVSLGAITVSVYRMVVSHKNMLRWQNSYEVSKGLKGTVREFIYIMLPTQIISLALLVLLWSKHEGFWLYLTLVFWLISPLIAFQISQKTKTYRYKNRDLKLLRSVACRSTRFFLELSNRDGNHLIPDHYQEEPITNSPAATSPTNIGLHLLSNLSAYDLGYISLSDFVGRTHESFEILNNLERFNGHFYNWYDIRSLQSLNPKYVSSVDSANFIMNILTLKQGLLDIISKPIIQHNSLSGLVDVMNVLAEDANLIINNNDVVKSDRRSAQHVYDEVSIMRNKISHVNKIDSISLMSQIIDGLKDGNEKIKKLVSNLNLGSTRGVLSSIYSSADHLNSLLRQHTEDLSFFMSFYQTIQTRPVIRQENKNQTLARVIDNLLSKLDIIPSLENICGEFKNEIESLGFIEIVHSANLDNSEKENIEHWYNQVIKNIDFAQNHALKTRQNCFHVIALIEKFFAETDFAFLYNRERGLFHIGYNVTFEKFDNSYFDFLASEANAVSFVAILKNDVPLKHWFYLGRKLVRLDMKNVSLISWGGSLFEYLTSLIFFKVHEDSLLGHTANVAIASHIKYCQSRHIPWGMGESAFSTFDLNNNYQYQVFGHPDLGLRRDLKDYLVIAPYTTIMSLAFKPIAAIANLRKMVSKGFLGRYGFYDAVDYTASMNEHRSNIKGQQAKIYYAHHQGFSLQALNNQVNNDRIHSLFISDPLVESLDTILEERIPSSIPAKPIKHVERLQPEYLAAGTDDMEIKQFIPVSTSYPRRALISNGQYMIDISNTGAGSSRFGDIYLNRFREDSVVEPMGQFIYLADTTKDNFWSLTTQPLGVVNGKNKIEYFENKARFNKIHNEIESSLTVSVAADENVEFRTLVLTNHGKDKRNLTITDYGEVSLAKFNDDLHHPAFQKLFIKSEHWTKYNALVYSRPDNSNRGNYLYFAHKIIIPSHQKGDYVYRTDRKQFISRGDSLHSPIKVLDNSKAEFELGYNFDPIFSIQNQISLEHNQTVTIYYINVLDQSKENLIKILKKYSNEKSINQAVIKSDKTAHEVISVLGMSREQAFSYQSLASRLLSTHYSPIIKKLDYGLTEAGVQTLWRLGISGDLPILVVRFYDMVDLVLIKNILICHKYLKYKGVAYDLVLLNEYPSNYMKSFEDEIDFLIRYNQTVSSKMSKGGVFHLRSSHIPTIDKENLLLLSRVLIDSKAGTLEQQIADIVQSNFKTLMPIHKPIKKSVIYSKDTYPDLTGLKFYNELGGFDIKNKEYVLNINYNNSLYTPSPWVNIISNDDVGSVVTESGSMYTWLIDSYDDRLTKRIDDPLIDRSSEVFYFRDEETGEFWNPTPLPIKISSTYTVRHGLGYSKFEHNSHGLEQLMSVFVPAHDRLKIVKIKLTNKTKFKKRLSLTGYFEICVGGANREDTKNYIKSQVDQETGAVISKNIFNEPFKNIYSFVDLNGGNSLVINDRYEFLGKNGELSNPAALKREKLSNVISDDVDSCVALQTFFELDPGEEIEIVSLIGGGQSIEEIQRNIKNYRNLSYCNNVLNELAISWHNRLNKIQINTPDESLNILFNTQLLYQVISSRLLARTGYFQPSGAYGFRDQLQDAMSLVWSNPTLVKEIILRASRHQFQEGDAQNWWHEHNSFGVRTAFSDHQLWLPYVTNYYLETTGDHRILLDQEPFMKGPLLDFINNPSWAGVPEISKEKYDLYDHCIRAIEKTFVFGKNGLPLIGNGDWNDGLNKVGEKGFGESVWLGWFLHTVIEKFVPHIIERGDYDRARRFEMTAQNLKNSLEKNTWDGKWYKRAFFDNGIALGTRSNKEFKIDSISQSWAVLSKTARDDRGKMAMSSVLKHLFQDDLLLLISPALKDTTLDPGYIKDYPPGVRENGAQYNHAALWAAQAFAELKDADTAMKIIDSVNPIKRSSSLEKVNLYRVEPYVVASDIYTKPAPAGRGGWTWYTGSAGVMYRTILESILGLKIRGDKMEINPCIPKDWKDFSLTYTYINTKYNIYVVNSSVGNKKIKLDGQALTDQIIELVNDHKTHEVEVIL